MTKFLSTQPLDKNCKIIGYKRRTDRRQKENERQKARQPYALNNVFKLFYNGFALRLRAYNALKLYTDL